MKEKITTPFNIPAGIHFIITHPCFLPALQMQLLFASCHCNSTDPILISLQPTPLLTRDGQLCSCPPWQTTATVSLASAQLFYVEGLKTTMASRISTIYTPSRSLMGKWWRIPLVYPVQGIVTPRPVASIQGTSPHGVFDANGRATVSRLVKLISPVKRLLTII